MFHEYEFITFVRVTFIYFSIVLDGIFTQLTFVIYLFNYLRCWPFEINIYGNSEIVLRLHGCYNFYCLPSEWHTCSESILQGK